MRFDSIQQKFMKFNEISILFKSKWEFVQYLFLSQVCSNYSKKISQHYEFFQMLKISDHNVKAMSDDNKVNNTFFPSK
jgi:hypothetical protein